MEVIAVEYFQNSIDTDSNEKISEFHPCIYYDNEKDTCDSHAHMFHLLKNMSFRNISMWHVNSMRRHQCLCQ